MAEAAYCNCLPILPRRLAFTELFKEDCFYETHDELVERLDNAVTNIDQTRSVSYRKGLERFDWEFMAQHYDKILGSMAPVKP